jgi:hypothetical protein
VSGQGYDVERDRHRDDLADRHRASSTTGDGATCTITLVRVGCLDERRHLPR